MPEDTIPRPIRYRFLEQAQKVCDLAKVDVWEYSEMLSSLREQMEASYRSYDQAGLYKDEAEEKALEDFGSVEEVARVHRDGWRGLWHRLLFSQRYAVYRLVAPVVFCMMHTFFKITGTLQVKLLASGDLEWKVALFGWDFYVGVFIIILVGFTRLAARILPVSKPLAEIIALAIATYWFGVLGVELIQNMGAWIVKSRIVDKEIPRWEDLLVGSVYMGAYIVEAVTFFFVSLMSASEILDVPSRQRVVIEAKRKSTLAEVDSWSWVVTNCFKLLSGQKGVDWKKTART